MLNFRRVNSERLPKPYGSPSAEVGEIDTRAPFQSVKAAVSLFGEVAVSKERCTARKSRLSAEAAHILQIPHPQTQVLYHGAQCCNQYPQSQVLIDFWWKLTSFEALNCCTD